MCPPDPIVRIRSAESDGFLMVLDLNKLPRQTLAKSRKIFRLMHRSDWLNEAAIQATEEWLRDLVTTALFVYEQSQWEHRMKRVDVKPRTRRPEDIAARLNNKESEAAEKAAQRDYNRAVRLQTYFNQERM